MVSEAGGEGGDGAAGKQASRPSVRLLKGVGAKEGGEREKERERKKKSERERHTISVILNNKGCLCLCFERKQMCVSER